MAHGDLGAQGRPSWQLLRTELDGLVEFRKGWRAQLHYLDRLRGGAAVLANEGLTPTSAQRRRWASGGQPTKANQTAIQRAYTRLRKHNVVRILTRRLNAHGGTRVEIHPQDQSGVNPDNRRDLNVRILNIRDWGPLVRAWAIGDWTAFQAEWNRVLENLGSDWRAYQYATSVGIQT
jgi:hypothetical protein